MKHILYYDNDIINSYAAQIFKGLPTKLSEEAGDTTEHELSESLKDSIKRFGISLGVTSGEYSPSEKNSENIELKSQYAKEFTEKVFHDNMLTIIMEYFHSDNRLILNSQNAKIGDYVCLSNGWKFLDIEYLKKLFSKSSWDKIKKILTLENNKTIGNTDQTSDNGVDNFRKVVDAFEVALPFSQIIIGDKFCAPIKPKYLRETLCEISFKYAPNRIKIFGHITNQLANSESKISNIADILPLMGTVASSLLGGNSYIITPIALYVE